MTEPSPYEQGFRDALLTVHSLILVHAQKYDANSEEASSLDALTENMTTLIDQKNHDLWSLLALAQASVPPEAQALRDHLRTPSGVLIDSAGRMLFLCLNGTEYDTGVLALLSENAELKARINLLCGVAGELHALVSTSNATPSVSEESAPSRT